MTLFRRSQAPVSSSSISTAAATSSLKKLVRRRSSDRSMNSSTHSATLCKATMPGERKRVEFSAEPAEEHQWELPEEDLWFPMEYLQSARKQEIKNNLRAQYYTKKDDDDHGNDKTPVDIESDELTWRGMEDIREQYNRKEKNFRHVQAVLTKYHALQKSNANADKAHHSLRVYAKSLSKEDRHHATKVAAQDAKFVDRPVQSPSVGALLGKKVTHSLRSWSPAPIRRGHANTFSHSAHSHHSHSCPPPSSRRQKSKSLDIGMFQWKFGATSSNDSLLSSQTTLTVSEHEQEQETQ